MAIRASATITLSLLVDIISTSRYYLLKSSTSSAPSKPTTNPPEGNWDDTEPTYTPGSTNSLYTVDLTVFSDGTFKYTSVSLSSSYEAAKEAYNKALASEQAAKAAADAADAAKIHESETPPEFDIPVGKLWLDRSVTPPVVRRWSGLADTKDVGWMVDMQGNPMLIEDVALRRFESLVTTFTPKQEATPYPPMGGKNLCDESALLPGYYGPTYANGFVENAAYRTIEQQLPAGIYTISISMDEKPYMIRMFRDGVVTSIAQRRSSFSFTLDAACVFTFVFRNTDTTASFTNLKVQIEGGETATDYAPYSLESPILGRNAVTLTHCGRNLFDGTIRNIGMGVAGTVAGGSSYGGFYIPVIPKATYTVSRKSANTNRFWVAACVTPPEKNDLIKIFDATMDTSANNQATQHTVTIPDGYYYLMVYLTNAAETIDPADYQVEIGDTAHAIEAYGGGPMVAELGDTYYGGRLDWISGRLEVTYGYEKLDSEVIDFDANWYGMYWAAVKLKHNAHEKGWAKCDSYPIVTEEPAETAAMIIGTDRVYIHDPRFTSMEQAAEILAGMDIYLAYQLETPYSVKLNSVSIAPKAVNSFISDAFSEDENDDDGIVLLYTASGWETINDVRELEEALKNTVTKEDFQHVVRVMEDGLHVGAIGSPSEVIIEHDSVNIVFGGNRYSKFARDYVQFGKYKIGLAEDEGLMFRPV